MGFNRNNYWQNRAKQDAKARRRKKRDLRKAEKEAERKKTSPIIFGPEFDQDQIFQIGDALPARWKFYPDGRVRVEERIGFRAQLGSALVDFGPDRHNAAGGLEPTSVIDCLMPDGTRGKTLVGEMEDTNGQKVWRRPKSKEGHWWPGRVRFSTEGAFFEDYSDLLPIEKIDEEENKFWLSGAMIGLSEFPEGKLFWTAFYNACTNSKELKSILRIDRYAKAFWRVFIDNDFVETSTGLEVYYTSDRRIGEILARLRGAGEDYLDFYWGLLDGLGPEPTEKDHKEIKRLLFDLGFEADN